MILEHPKSLHFKQIMMNFPLQAVQGLSDVRTGRNTLSNSYGWFYIHFLVSVANNEAQKLIKKYNEQFDPTYMIQPNWYCSHFAEEEFADIKSSKIIEIFEHKKPNMRSTLADEQKFIVKAVNGWKPKTENSQSTHIGYNHFVVTDSSYESLVNDPDVLSVNTYSNMQIRNRFSVGYLQNGNDQLVNEEKRYWIPRPLTKRGLNGEGQIVGVLDSGLDVNHNFFYDSEHKFEYNKFDESQRKVVYYDTTYGDNGDHESGHGTHVSGTVVGKSWKNNSEASLYDGVAPEAKLYFVDLGKEDNPRRILAYDNVNVTEKAISKGVGIFSKSFYSNIPVDEMSYIEDKISWDHKDFLTVISAGNEGILNNVGSAPDAVNALSVGNVIAPAIFGIDVPQTYGSYSLISKEDQNQKIVLIALSDVVGTPTTKEGDLLDVDDIEVSTTPQENAICLIPDEGKESIEEGIKKANTAHCTFVVVENNTHNITYKTPAYKCSSDQYKMLSEFKHVMYRANSTVDTTFTGQRHESSSIGPSYMGVLKPDISAPGTYIASAKSAGYNSKPTNDTSFNTLTLKKGTSMATPAISGCATLFRQYFMQGWYPSGNKTKKDEFKPSSSLLKAALINSAAAKRNNGIGHGIPNLERGMGFGDFGVMFVNDEKINPKEEQAYEIHVEKEGSLFITLSYVDYPRYYKSFRTLTNPIHMRIESPNGIVSEPPAEQKSLTTNSKIMITAQPGTYKLFITSTNYVNTSVQMQYSLAIMGGFKTQKLEKSATATATNCSKGTYKNGRCQCDENSFGTYCQNSILKEEVVCAINGINWYEFDIKPNEKYTLVYQGKSIDVGVRFCLSGEIDIDINSRMFCYMLSYHDNNLSTITSSTGKFYAAVYPTKATGKLYAVKYDSIDQKNEDSIASNSYEGTVLIACVVVFIILFIGLLLGIVIYCIFCRNKNNKRDEASSQLEHEINVLD